MEISRIFSEYRDEIFAAFWVTIKLTAYSGLAALIIGTVLAAMRFHRCRCCAGWARGT